MILPPYTFRGGVAVLTGAASGIGRALALQLAGQGSHLALIDQDEAGLITLASDLEQVHPQLRVTAHPFDLSHTAEIPQLADDVLRAHRRVTLLINNAGVALGGTFEQITLEQFEWVQSINFRAPVALVKAFLPALSAELHPQIVNVSSLYGLLGPVGQSAYAASKFAIRGFSEVLRHELASRGIGVTVVHPGGVRTNIANNARTAPGTSEAEAEAGKRAMNRVLSLDPEVAAAIILRAAERRTPRVLVGTDAKVLDVLARLLPGTYWGMVGSLMARRSGV
ncbi:SDR family NAD(P)-dependent oxidoreductase [Deinococcus sp. Arct2-2]|uniref:SDR family NAD(P)-dependent oxidoreductase n=1 Tax=Deinococcus sp. Arct2-2 TaxID=2568653 RepID=UPI0010A58721|nr:SDR family NAD(P)-dependent oxidoreductase [Deinococcus sp. Arct2-2]THF70156.1 SDR family NAD(P)-dependent oxidoreductase [Deinococcus sp. Arct2-2]